LQLALPRSRIIKNVTTFAAWLDAGMPELQSCGAVALNRYDCAILEGGDFVFSWVITYLLEKDNCFRFEVKVKMIQISIVGSVHEEKGLANETELVRILEHLRPNVIFLEIPTSLNEEQIISALRETLESRSVELYRQHHTVEFIPVDLPTPHSEFFKGNEHRHKKLKRLAKNTVVLLTGIATM
jgi:hypothetical protein